MLTTIVSGFVIEGGCSSNDSSSAVGAGCSIASDCTDPFVCAYARCHAQCTESKDCPAGERCVGSNYPKLGVCLLDDEDACDRNSDCAAPLVCGRRARCEKQCSNDRDCLASQVCSIGSCADIVNISDSGLDAPLGEAGQTCLLSTDCAEPLVCKNGFCAASCGDDRDCTGGQHCNQGVCTSGAGDAGAPADAPAGYGAPCDFTSECPAGSTLICISGRCIWECGASGDCQIGQYCNDLHRCIIGSPPDGGADVSLDVGDGKTCGIDFDCDDSVFCNGRERCLGGKCAAASETACDPHSSCYVGNCDEGTRTCKAPTKIGTGDDVDHDGHIDKGCGGDDCNDLDATTYKGAPELCDGRDNDCNGIVDDGSVAPRGIVLTAPISSTAHYSGSALTVGTTGLVLELQANTTSVDDVWASSIDESTLATTPMTKVFDTLGKGVAGRIFATAGGAGSGLLVWNRATDASDHVDGLATIVGADGAASKTITLRAPPSGMYGANAVWTGTQWLVAWSYIAGTFDVRAGFGFIQTDGTSDLRTLPSAGGLGSVYTAVNAAVIGSSDATLAIAYAGKSNVLMVVTLGSSGTLLSGPTVVSTGTSSDILPIAIAGTTTGFIIAYTQSGATYAAYVSKTGEVGVTGLLLPMPLATSGAGTFDGMGGALALSASDGLHLVYGRRDLKDGVDHTIAFTPPSPGSTDLPNIDFVAGKLVLSQWVASDQTARFVRVGCLPTP